MSPARRSSGEIHILAMLDGRAGGRRMRGRPALRWYGAGAVLACTLLAALAWLVRSAPVRDASHAVVAAATPPAQAAPTLPTAPVPQTIRTRAAAPDGSAAPNARGTPEAEATPEANAAPAIRGAHIVDMAQPARTTSAPALPEAAAPGPARNVPPRDDLAADVPAAGARDVRSAVAHGHRTPAPAPAPRIAALVAPARPQPASRLTPHVAPSPPGSQSAPRSPSLARAETPPARHKRGPAAVRVPSAPPATVDTDVAVISAILQHAAIGTDTADVNPAAACSDKPCGPRMPSR